MITTWVGQLAFELANKGAVAGEPADRFRYFGHSTRPGVVVRMLYKVPPPVT